MLDPGPLSLASLGTFFAGRMWRLGECPMHQSRLWVHASVARLHPKTSRPSLHQPDSQTSEPAVVAVPRSSSSWSLTGHEAESCDGDNLSRRPNPAAGSMGKLARRQQWGELNRAEVSKKLPTSGRGRGIPPNSKNIRVSGRPCAQAHTAHSNLKVVRGPMKALNLI